MTAPREGIAERLTGTPAPDPERLTNWDVAPYAALPVLALDHHMGARPAHFPRTEARFGWDADAFVVMFRVEDRYVRAAARQHQDAVCKDSCVACFFVPGLDVARGYFNLEINCGGTMLLHFQERPRHNPVALPPTALARIDIQHSLPHIVDPEIQEPVTWYVEARVPLDMLAPYTDITRPAAGARWRANFYKCGDGTSHPHWLTWSPVQAPSPNFHIPDQFGLLTFA